MTLKEIKNKPWGDNFIEEMKKKLKDWSTTEFEVYSICSEVFVYSEGVVEPLSLQKRILKELHTGHPCISRRKSLMRSYVNKHSMYRVIKSLVKSCKVCPLAVKAPPIKFNPWPETDCPWSRLHIDFAGPLVSSYNLIVVDSFSKWPEMLGCKKQITGEVIRFLHELFARFWVPDSIDSDNGTQFTSTVFKGFCKLFVVEHITIAPYHPRSNNVAKRFVDTLKRALKKSNGWSTEAALQQFLPVYRITVNKDAPIAITPTGIMFMRKIIPVFDKLISNKKKVEHKVKKVWKWILWCGWKGFLPNVKGYWEAEIIVKWIGWMIYLVKGLKMVLKGAWIKKKKRRHTDEENDTPVDVEPKKVLLYSTLPLRSFTAV